MSRPRLTHLGGPTTLIELDGWKILTDPTFDPPGRLYRFGWGTSSHKIAGPAEPPDDVFPVDLVLLSHDHHADNLDDSGRALLGQAATVVTTVPGARRLGSSNVRGLADWESTTVTAPGRPPLDHHRDTRPARPQVQQTDRRESRRFRAAPRRGRHCGTVDVGRQRAL